MFGKLALETRTKETMKKAGAPCLNLKGNGRWSTAGKDSNHGTDVQKGKPIPNKTEKKKVQVENTGTPYSDKVVLVSFGMVTSI